MYVCMYITKKVIKLLRLTQKYREIVLFKKSIIIKSLWNTPMNINILILQTEVLFFLFPLQVKQN